MKIFSIVLAGILSTLIILVVLKAGHNEALHRKITLSREVKSGLNSLMIDLIGGRQPLVRKLPVDGLWHQRIAMIKTKQANLKFLMLMRRKQSDRNILEVQVEDPESHASICFFKIRMRR